MLGLGVSIPETSARGGAKPFVPRLVAGDKVGFLGDSNTARASSASGTLIESKGGSYVTHLKRLAPYIYAQDWYDSSTSFTPNYADVDASPNFINGANMGKSGDTASGMKRRLAQLKDMGIKAVVFQGGTNTGSTDTAAAVVKAADEYICKYFVDNGIAVVLTTIYPRGDAAFATRTPAILEINDNRRIKAAEWGAILADPWEDLRNQSYPVGHAEYGKPNAVYFDTDLIHLSMLGGYIIAKNHLKPKMGMLFPTGGSWHNADPTSGNLLTNGNLTGTTGTKGAAVTGDVATDFSVANTTTTGFKVTCVGSKVTNPVTGGQTQVLQITSDGTGSAGGSEIIQIARPSNRYITTGFTASDYVQAWWHVRADASNALATIDAINGATTATNARATNGITAGYTSGQSTITEAFDWVVSHSPMGMSGKANSHPRLHIRVRTDVAQTFNVYIDKAIARVVPSPSSDFPWVP